MSSRLAQSPALVLSACLMSAAGALLVNLMPIVFGAAARDHGLDEGQLGWLGSINLAGFALAAATANLWIDRVRWRRASLAGLLLGVASYTACAVVGVYPALLVALALAGIGSGVIYTVAIAVLAENRNPDRAFAFKLSAETLSGVLLLLVLPALVVERFGYAGLMLTLAALLALLSAPALACLPAGRRAGEPVSATDAPVSFDLVPWIGLAGLALSFSAVTALWAFLEQAASSFSVGTARTTVVLTIAAGLNGGFALVAAALSTRFGRVPPLLWGLGMMLLGLFMLSQRPDELGYTVGALLVIGHWSFVMSFQMGLIASCDASGRIAVMIPAAITLGGAAGPGIAGMVLEGRGYGSLYTLLGATIVLSLLAFLWLARQLQRRGRENAGPVVVL